MTTPPRSASRTVLPVRSIDVVFLRALQAGRVAGRVHSVFHRVVNLERASGGLFTLAACELDNAPDTAIIDVPHFDAVGIVAGDAFISTESELHIGIGMAMPWATATVWQASLPRYGVSWNQMDEQLRAARSYLAHMGEGEGGGGGWLGHPRGAASVAPELLAALQQRSTWLLAALAQGRDSDACRHAVSMIGLGPGLTPSGDDFMVGFFAVLNIAGSPCFGRLNGGADVLLHAAEATHAISLAALSAAAEGRVRESISTLIESLIHATPDTLFEPLQRVLAIGATSGADIVAGILAGLGMNLRVQSGRAVETPPQPCLAAAA